MALTPQQFKAFIYQGGADDAVATQRGIDYAQSMGLTSQQATKLFNDALGTNFSPSSYESVVAAKQGTQISPQEFRNLIYAGGADDAVATQRGVDYLKNMGYTPTEATSLFNQALGTNFTVGDYNRVAGPATGNAFRDYIYEGTGGNDTLATVRGINYAKSLGLTPQQTVDLFNTSLGTNFTQADLTRVGGEATRLSAGATQGAGLLTGNDFKNYIYQGTNGNDTQATVRGILYADSLGLTPQQTVNLFNSSLGTNFTIADLTRARGEVQSVAPVEAPIGSNFRITPPTTVIPPVTVTPPVTPVIPPVTPVTPPVTPVTPTTPRQPTTPQSPFAQNFANYQAIPIGAQYNPAVTPGGVSPYSAIMSQMNNGAFQNPYANFVPNTPLGGYNPNLYSELAVLNKVAADKAQSLIDSGGDGGGGGGGGGGDGGMAKGGYVHGGLIFGPNPPGPDDGAVNLDMGEYVINKSSVKKYGRGLLDMINEGKVPAKKIRSLLD